jgi:hypothetical protein
MVKLNTIGDNKMKTIKEQSDNNSKKLLLMQELDELENIRKNIDPNSDEAYRLSLMALKKINEMIDL